MYSVQFNAQTQLNSIQLLSGGHSLGISIEFRQKRNPLVKIDWNRILDLWQDYIVLVP